MVAWSDHTTIPPTSIPHRSRPLRVVSVNPPTTEQARAMVREAAPQIAAVLDAAGKDKEAA